MKCEYLITGKEVYTSTIWCISNCSKQYVHRLLTFFFNLKSNDCKKKSSNLTVPYKHSPSLQSRWISIWFPDVWLTNEWIIMRRLSLLHQYVGCWGSCFYFIVKNYKSISRHKFVSEKIVYLYLSKESCFICFVFTTNKMSSFLIFIVVKR